MTFFERFEALRKSRKISQGKLEKELGFSNGSISKWKDSMPNPDRLQKAANFLGVSIDYLLNGEDDLNKLTEKDEKDITKDVDNLMRKLTASEDGPALYDGSPISIESMEMFRDELEISLRRLKLINKEKYNPNKNKK